MYTEAGLQSHMSFFVCIYLSVFIGLSLHSVYVSPHVSSPLQPFTHLLSYIWAALL